MRVFLLFLLILISSQVIAQPKPKEKQSSQNDMNKLMEDAMKGMSEEEKAEMKKMMGSVMPALMEQNSKTADYPEFTSNKQLVPKKDIARINAIPKKKLSQADISTYAANLYNKLITKGDAGEIAIVKKVIAQSPRANDLGSAAILCMMQGHPQAAMALSMKAVQADLSNPNWQNNMASMLTQYGYPEQAIPVLQKLKNQFPTNSTVLNNLAYAWLGLGETDSAKNYAGQATRANPNHPDARICGGLMEEIKGDPTKATDDYVESMENSVNPFTETVIKNNKGQSKLEKIDFEKIKRSIAIYEYFPKDWMPEIPLLSSTVSGYANDYATKVGYDKMADRLTEKLEAMTNELSKELESLADKGEEEFVKTMAKETMQGLSFMSKPAVSVLTVLMNYQKEWILRYSDETLEIVKLKEEYNQVYQKTIKNLRGEQSSICPRANAAANEYMQAVNPMVKRFFLEKAEEFRQWVNAYITWSWYVAGNPKNVVMIQDLGFVGLLEQMYQSAMEYQVAINDNCKPQREQAPNTITEPEIPNFTCPAVVSIPMGADWQQLSKAASNFDNNDYVIKNNPAHPIPNQTIAYNANNATIAEPGNDPFIKAANGTMSPGIPDPEISNAANTAEILSNYMQNRSSDFTPDLSTPDRAATSVTNDIVKVSIENKTENFGQGDGFRAYIDNRIAQQKAIEQKQGEWFREYINSRVEQQKAMEAQEQASSNWFREYMKDKIEKQKVQEARGRKQMDWFREYIKSKIEAQKIADKIAIDKAIQDKIKQAQKSKLAQELLHKMMTADCENVRNSKDILKEKLDRMMKGVKELEAYENIIEQIKKLEKEIDQKEADAQKKEQFKKQIERMQQETDKMDTYEQLQQSKKEMEKIMSEMDAMDEKKLFRDNQNKIQQLVDEMEGTLPVLQNIKQNGLQPSISSGMQATGIFTPVKGLFN